MSLKKTAKKVIGFILHLLFLDSLIFFLSKLLYFFSKLLFLRDWSYSTSNIPKFFKHQINLNFWRFDPAEWTFTLRGVYAREEMFLNCKVLDLCCGDGSYSYLFFSDISANIDAIDFDSSAISYAGRYFKHPKINFKKVNIITEPFPANDYDVIVWNAGICYFYIEDIHLILNKIVNSGKPGMMLCGMLPKANGHVDHKTEFEDAGALRTLFDQYFDVVNIKEVIEGNNTTFVTFYFKLSKPKSGRVIQ